MTTLYADSLIVNFAGEQERLATPTGFGLTVNSSTQITLDWTDVESDGIVSIERSLLETSGFAVIATVAAGVETYANSGLTTATQYYYRIRAYYLPAGYSPYSDTENATTS